MPITVKILTSSECECKQIKLTGTWHAVNGLILQRKGGISRTDIWRLKVFPLKCKSFGSSSNCPPWSLSSETTSCNGRVLGTNTKSNEHSSYERCLVHLQHYQGTAVEYFSHGPDDGHWQLYFTTGVKRMVRHCQLYFRVRNDGTCDTEFSCWLPQYQYPHTFRLGAQYLRRNR